MQRGAMLVRCGVQLGQDVGQLFHCEALVQFGLHKDGHRILLVMHVRVLIDQALRHLIEVNGIVVLGECDLENEI